jgi:ribosomal protein S6
MEETKTYELGLLLTPLLTEEGAVGLLAGAMKQMFARHEIKVTSADVPKMIPLAYVIRKRIDNKNQIFREAFFVSLRFSALPEAIPELTTELGKISEVIRSLVIIIPKVTEVVQDRRSPTTVRSIAKATSESQVTKETVVETVVANKANQKEMIDRGIDDLLAVTSN